MNITANNVSLSSLVLSAQLGVQITSSYISTFNTSITSEALIMDSFYNNSHVGFIYTAHYTVIPEQVPFYLEVSSNESDVTFVGSAVIGSALSLQTLLFAPNGNVSVLGATNMSLSYLTVEAEVLWLDSTSFIDAYGGNLGIGLIAQMVGDLCQGGVHTGIGGGMYSNCTEAECLSRYTYDYYNAVDYPARAGSPGACTGGGDEGGIITISTWGECHIDGTLSANGRAAINNGGGGAGGSISINTTLLDGRGSVTANGGNGSYSIARGGGGGILLRLGS